MHLKIKMRFQIEHIFMCIKINKIKTKLLPITVTTSKTACIQNIKDCLFINIFFPSLNEVTWP